MLLWYSCSSKFQRELLLVGVSADVVERPWNYTDINKYVI